jgi:Domain of unknown function (DUF4129)
VATASDSLTGAAPGLRRVAYGLVSVVVVVLVVGAGTGAARSEDPGRGAAGWSSIGDPGWLLDAGVSVVGVAAVAAAAVLMYALWPGGQPRRRGFDEPEAVHEPPQMRRWEKVVAVAFPPALVGALIWALVATRSLNASAPSPPVAPSQPSTSDAQRVGASAPVIHWWVVAAVVAVAVAMVALLLVVRRRRWRALTDRPQADRRGEAIGAVDYSLDALEAEPDSRMAVIAAYARMERWLAQAGVPRAAWEAPFEYLERVLIELGAPAAIAASLAELFERARFAPHPVAGSMKRRAIEVLVELRSELGRAT